MIKGIHHISMKCGTVEELTNVRKFYIETLGLKIIREWAESMMIDTGNGLLEFFYGEIKRKPQTESSLLLIFCHYFLSDFFNRKVTCIKCIVQR